MKFKLTGILIFLLPIVLLSQHSVLFETYFVDKTLRIDYFLIGNAEEETITIDQIYQQGAWAGHPMHLIDSFNNGMYTIKVYDIASNSLIYSKGFNCLFGEYQTTDPAINGKKRSYHNTALIPYPKKPINFVLEKRDRNNISYPVLTEIIDPAVNYINSEKCLKGDRIYKAMVNGYPHEKVDIVWIAEGYTVKDYDRFTEDVDHYVNVLFQIEPFKQYKKRFNIFGLFRPSSESGPDEPRKKIYRNTAVNASFNALNLERYLLTEDNKSMHDIASLVPYDCIEILVNSDRYGGGGIYNDYAVTTVRHDYSENVFIHEFGHSFAGLADEYYSSNVAYNEFYPKGVEPTEPNITALLDPDLLKWKDLLSRGIGVPTKYGKNRIEALQKDIRNLRKQKEKKKAQLKKDGHGEGDIKKMETSFQEKREQMAEEIRQIRAENVNLQNKVGVFEGAGYSSKGLYRPMMECIMFSNKEKKFCAVCQKAIIRMINYYTE